MFTIFWVSPDVDEWRLQREGHHRPEKMFKSREDAIDWACRVAADQAPAQVKVQDYSGNLTREFAFARGSVIAAQ